MNFDFDLNAVEAINRLATVSNLTLEDGGSPLTSINYR